MFSKIVILAVCCSIVYSAKIIGIFMTPSYSHQIVYQPIWKELSLQGHEVTVVTPNPLNDKSLINLTEIDIHDISYEAWLNSKLPELAVHAHSSFDELNEISEIYMSLSEIQLSHPKFQELIRNESGIKYDLFLVEYLWPAMYAFKDIFDCPMVGISSLPLPGSIYSALGMPHHPVLDPDVMLPFATNLDFSKRVISFLMDVLIKYGGVFTFYPRMNSIVKRYFGEKARDFDKYQVNLVLVNSNYAITNIKPTVPQYVEISGIHLQPRKPLPNDIQTILDDSRDVIYFSLGTNVKSSYLPPEKLKEFMDAFSGLPYKVIWKYETDNIPDIPSNVIIKKWLPQQDVLAHPNIKLFITQGGIQSIDEALYNKIPVLIIPFFGDQKYNADMMVQNGGGLTINFHNFTSGEMRNKIISLMNDKKYKETMRKLSAIAFDHPMSALDKAVWHINYVLRHNGASHLIYKGRDLPLYQYYMLDVYGIFLVAIFVVFVVIRMLVRIVKLLFGIRKIKTD